MPSLLMEYTSSGAAEAVLRNSVTTAGDDATQLNGQAPRQESTDSMAAGVTHLYETKLNFEIDQSTDVMLLTAAHIQFSAAALEQDGDQRLAIIADVMGKCRFDELFTEATFLAPEPAMWFVLAMMRFRHAHTIIKMAAHLGEAAQNC